MVMRPRSNPSVSGVKLLDLAHLSSGWTCCPPKSLQAVDSHAPAGFESTEVDVEDRREEGLDATLAETFPCSDPLSSIPNPLPTLGFEGGT